MRPTSRPTLTTPPPKKQLCFPVQLPKHLGHTFVHPDRGESFLCHKRIVLNECQLYPEGSSFSVVAAVFHGSDLLNRDATDWKHHTVALKVHHGGFEHELNMSRNSTTLHVLFGEENPVFCLFSGSQFHRTKRCTSGQRRWKDSWRM